MMHSCPDCGLVHFVDSPREDPSVAIARINADSALAIAKLQSRTDKTIAEVEAESAVEVAEAQAEVVAAVLSSEADEADPVADEAPESGPVVVSTPIIDSGNDVDETAPPKHDEVDHQDDEEPKPKKKGLGLW